VAVGFPSSTSATSTDAAGGGSVSVDVNPPPGLAPGEAWGIVAILDTDGGTIATPSDFEPAHAQINGNPGYPALRTFVKAAGDDESAVTVSASGGQNYVLWCASIRISGADVDTPIGNVSTPSVPSGTGVTIEAPGITVQKAGSAALMIVAASPTEGVLSIAQPGTSTLLQARHTPNEYPSGAVAYELRNAGAYTPGTWSLHTSNESEGRVAITLEISPAAGAPAELAGAAQAVAAASGTLTTQIRAAAAAADVASATAAMTTSIRLSAAATNTAAATAIFAAGAVMNAAALDVATATAALSTAIRAQGHAVDTAIASGTLTNWATVTLAGDLYTGPGGALAPDFWLDSAPGPGTTLYYDAQHIQIYPSGEISSDTNDCVAVVQFFDGTSWALGVIVLTPHLAAAAEGSAAAAGQLTTAVQLAAAASALATTTAAFSTGAGLSADATGQATAAGDLATQIPLSALAQAVSAAAGNLSTQIQLAAAATGRASADGNLNGVIALNAAAEALAASLAALTTGVPLGAAAQGSAGATGSLTTAVRLSGVAGAAVSAIASLSTQISLGGAAQSAVSSTGDLTTARLLVAAAIDAATATAILATGISLRANALGVSSASVELSTASAAMADAAAQTTVTALLSDVIESPPIGAYVLDPAYVVSRAAAGFGTRKTARFRPKFPDQVAVLTFDVSDQLAPDEKLQGKVTLQIACIAGMDAAATSLFRGVPSYDPTYRRILQPVRGGIDASTYYIKVSAATTNPERDVALAALLPVKA